LVRIKLGGVAEEFANIGTHAFTEVLKNTSGALLVGETLSIHLSKIVGNGGNLENLFEESAHHVLGIAHVTFVAVGKVVIEGLVILAVVSDRLECVDEVAELSVPVEGHF
jgi:hypothetical protein